VLLRNSFRASLRYGVESDATVHGHVNLRGSPTSGAVTYGGTVQFTGPKLNFPPGSGTETPTSI
jgi:hypothetical protein